MIISVAFNFAMLTMSGVYAAASAAVSAVGVTTAAARDAAEQAKRRDASRALARETSERVTRRVQRGAARNIASVGGEAIPVVGVAVIAGALAYDVRDACDTAADMAGLEAALAAPDGADLDAARHAAVEAFDCAVMIREDLPDRDAIWAQVKASPQAAWETAADHYVEFQDIDWGIATANVRNATADFFGALDPMKRWQEWWKEDQPAQ